MKYKKKYSIEKSPFIYNVLKFLFMHDRLTRHLFNFYIRKFEGGEYYSTTLRRIYSEVYDINVGIGSYGSIFSTTFRPHVNVGAYCSFAQGINRLFANHPLDHLSTHPLFHLKEFGGVSTNSNPTYRLTIGNDVWVGVNAIITSSCRSIGDGAVIGAGSVVTHDVEPYAIVAGNPARVIRYRFTPDVQREIMESHWYELTPDQLIPIIKMNLSHEEMLKMIKDKTGREC